VFEVPALSPGGRQQRHPILFSCFFPFSEQSHNSRRSAQCCLYTHANMGFL